VRIDPPQADFGNNSHQAKRSQIRLSDPPQAESSEFAV